MGVISIRWNPSDPSDTPSFRWKSACSSLETLRKISPIFDVGVENRSDGIHRIHRTRKDSDGKVHVLFGGHLEKFFRLDMGLAGSLSDGIHRIQWKRTYSDEKVYFLFERECVRVGTRFLGIIITRVCD